MKLLALAIGFLVTSAAPASAATILPSGWVVTDGGSVCGASQVYKGPGRTRFTFVHTDDDVLGIQLSNSGWTINRDTKYQFRLELGETEFEATGFGSADMDNNPAFFIVVNQGFMQRFRSARKLTVWLGSVVADDISLNGSAVAASLVEDCYAERQRSIRADTRETEAISHIAANPFYDPTAARWFGASDYPADALHAGIEGRVTFQIKVANDGKVTACDIVASSGTPSLDARTCEILKQRGAYAADSVAVKTGGTAGAIQWRLPN